MVVLAMKNLLRWCGEVPIGGKHPDSIHAIDSTVSAQDCSGMVQPTLQISQSRMNASNHLRQGINITVSSGCCCSSKLCGRAFWGLYGIKHPATNKKDFNLHKDNALSWIDCITLRVWLFLPGFLHPWDLPWIAFWNIRFISCKDWLKKHHHPCVLEKKM